MGFLRTGLTEQIPSLQKQQSLTIRYMAARNHSTMPIRDADFEDIPYELAPAVSVSDYETLVVPVYDNVQNRGQNKFNIVHS